MSRQLRVAVRFLKDTHLPRFTMKKGQTWEKRSDRFTDNGFPCGGGFVEKDRYEEIGGAPAIRGICCTNGEQR